MSRSSPRVGFASIAIRSTKSSAASGNRLQQLVNRRRIVQHVDGPAARVEQLQAWIDAEDVIDGGVDVARRDGTGVRPFAQTVGRADDLAALDAALLRINCKTLHKKLSEFESPGAPIDNTET